jgi:hypothetical protein
MRSIVSSKDLLKLRLVQLAAVTSVNLRVGEQVQRITALGVAGSPSKDLSFLTRILSIIGNFIKTAV